MICNLFLGIPAVKQQEQKYLKRERTKFITTPPSKASTGRYNKHVSNSIMSTLFATKDSTNKIIIVGIILHFTLINS